MRADQAWDRIIELAIQERVAAVCLSGDIADQDNKFWEAIGPLERGIRRLAEASIRTVAVAGNHDHDVLPRLADQFSSQQFMLLGRGGSWERLTIDEGGRPLLHIDGWSFPNQRVHVNPLDSYNLERDLGVPILGMVHGDLNQTNSPYAPLDLTRLRTLAPTSWLLGHIHAPRLLEGPSWVLYPGSPQALDPGEPGPHGVWITEVSDGTIGVPEPHPLSSVWYEQHTIELSGTEDEGQVESHIYQSIRERAERIVAEAGPHLTHISMRLHLVGATPVAYRLAEVANRIREDLTLSVDTVSVAVETVAIESLPPIDLAEHAKTHAAPGALARLLLELDQPEFSSEVADLLRRARDELGRIEAQRDLAQLEQREVTDEMVRDHLRTQGRALLTQLMTQNG